MKDHVTKLASPIAIGRWVPCTPLLCTRAGIRFYHGSAAFSFADGRTVIRPVYDGAPADTASTVLREVRERMASFEPPTI